MNFQTTSRRQQYDYQDLQLVEGWAIADARRSFWAFRQYINPGMMIGWWQRQVAAELQKFLQDLIDGKRPKLVMQSPPQHGKSKQVIDFISYVAGHMPECNTIYTSYSNRLCTRANLNLQRIMDGRQYRNCFPKTKLSARGAVGSRFLRNLELLEYVNQKGSFRATTVMGPITGESLNLGLVDDPLKGRAEAQSKTIRDRTWGWFTDDFFTRFSENAGLLMILTRWHVDDPVGRLREEFPDVKLLRYPAIAEEDNKYRKAGEPLFPQLKSLDFLMERKRLLTAAGWESIYQQNPIIVGGGLFPIDRFEIELSRPANHQVRKSVRYWDKAGTEDGGAFTAGVLIEELRNGQILIADVKRGQWSALERETRIRQTAIIDNQDREVETWVEQEPGSGGKESAESTIRNLKGYVVKADRVTGAKEIRAEPYAAQVQGGNVSLLRAAWNQTFMDEHEVFPNGKYKDQVDAASAGFMKVSGRLAEVTVGTVKGLY